MQAPTEVGGLGYIGLGIGIGAAEEEDGWSGGDCDEELGVAGGDEVEVGSHEVIVVWKTFFAADLRGLTRI